LYLLTDKLHRLAAHTNLIRQDLRLFAFDHASHQKTTCSGFKRRPSKTVWLYTL
jgi:hypothetical protein